MVAFLTREHGRVQALAKGAHRLESQFLGRLDFLNEVRLVATAERSGLRLLTRVDLRRERRGLRQPQRFLAASHLAWLCELAWPDPRPEPHVYDLLHGGLLLLERCPETALATTMVGLELRQLQLLGGLPDLQHCSRCGAALTDGRTTALAEGGLCCERHQGPGRPLGHGALALLQRLAAASGRHLPHCAGDPALNQLLALPAQWLQAATEQRSPLRPLVFRAAASGAAPKAAAENARRQAPGPQT